MVPDSSEDERRRFAEHYSKMSDGELLKLALRPWALSDAAWQALDDGLDHRDLEPPEPEPPPQTVALDKRNLVPVRKFRDLPEALLAKGRLDSAGIESFLADDNTVRVDWLWSDLLGGVKLLVDAENAEAANEILSQPIPESFDVDEDEDYQQPRCPQCRSLDVSFEELYKPIAYGSLFVGLPFPVHRKGWICHSCRHAWQDEAPDEAEAS
jgi:hypothetical protein